MQTFSFTKDQESSVVFEAYIHDSRSSRNGTPKWDGFLTFRRDRLKKSHPEISEKLFQRKLQEFKQSHCKMCQLVRKPQNFYPLLV